MQSIRGNHDRSGQWLPYAALLFTWALVHTVLVVFRDVPVFESGLVGPDSYMRLVRVAELYQGWNWFDGTIARANAPYGDTLHWTRPFDLLLMLIALPIAAFTGYEQAIYVAGIVISPLLQLATTLALIWTLRPLIRPEVWFLPVVAMFLQPGALAYSIFGQADHHTLLLLVFVVAAGFTLRALRDPLNARDALLAGATTGFGIWISVEFLLVLGICLAALGLPWLCGEPERARQNKWFALALGVVLLIAVFVELPFDRLLEPSYDRVSSVQLLVAVGVLLFWRTAETYEGSGGRPSRPLERTVLVAVGLGALGLLVHVTFPAFLAGPMAEVDPRIRPLWLDRVVEMQPVMPRDRESLQQFVFYLGGGFLAVPLIFAILVKERGTDRFWPLFFVALASLLLWIVATRHLRFSGYAETAFVLAFAVALDRFLRWTGRIGNDLTRGLLRGSFITTMLLGPILLGIVLTTEEAKSKESTIEPTDGCDVREVATYLETDPRWSARPHTILAFLDIGPELLYRTRHAVIGTPYHRNASGIYDGYRILATTDDSLARGLMEQRRVDLVLLCQARPERGFYAPPEGEENLYRRLDQGNPPGWLTPVDLPPSLEGQARLYSFMP